MLITFENFRMIEANTPNEKLNRENETKKTANKEISYRQVIGTFMY